MEWIFYQIHINYVCLIIPKYDCSLVEYLTNYISTNERVIQIENMLFYLYFKSIHKHFIIHRDVKPDNFMIKNETIYLIDFWIIM
jgi:serine/threonine protein kinase